MPEEFEWLHEDMKTRGARVNEAIQIIRLVLGGGMVEFHGKYYDFDRLTMAPTPKKRVPIYVGGTTKPALRRAARYGDGWLGIIHSMEEIKGIVPDLSRQRREFGREKEPFDILLMCPEARTVDDIRRLEDLGVTDLQVTPWLVYGEPAEAGVAALRQQPQLGVKLEAIKRYGEEVIARVRS
jgi:alkanesulfonate monooxygenase SsuD/methylene tetrahydromethanopterin reductase-like flavin-dependent oxidoreductase (luciferase family)